MPAVEQPPHSPSPRRRAWGRTLALAAIVALCAGVVSGSCAGLVTWGEAAMVAAGYPAAAFLARVPFLLGQARSPWLRPRAARVRQFRRRGAHYRNYALISGIAIAISAVAVLWGFYANANGLVMTESGQTRAGR